MVGIGLEATELRNMGRWSLRQTLTVALGIYAALAIPAAIVNREQINPDAVSYIRLASYITEGRLTDAVSSYWSPLISWLIAPLLALGVDGLHAARLVLLASGAGFMAAASLYLHRTTTLGWRWTVAVLLLLALVATHFVVCVITPDIPMAALMMLYFCCATDRRLLQNWRWPLLAGFLGGVAYLAKAYALPFFLIHFPMTLGLQYLWRRAETRLSTDPVSENPRGWRRVLAAGIAGLLAFGLVAGPWIGVLSWKYGHLTAASAGIAARAMMEPAYFEKGRPLPLVTGLWVPAPGRLTQSETPEEFRYESWSPFENAASMKYQVKQIITNGSEIQHILTELDVFGLTLAVIGLSPFLVYLLRGCPGEQFKVLWTVGTFLCYCSGFFLVFVEGRYIQPVLWPLGCILCFHLGGTLLSRLKGSESVRDYGKLSWLMALVLIASFGTMSVYLVAKDFARKDVPYRLAAHQVAETGCTGPVASTNRHAGLFTSYHLDLPYLGRPLATSPEECALEIDRCGTQTFLVWRDSPLWDCFARVPSWKKVTEIKDLGASYGEAVQVYAKVSPALQEGGFSANPAAP